MKLPHTELRNVGYRKVSEHGVKDLLCGGKGGHASLRRNLQHEPSLSECVQYGTGMLRFNDATSCLLSVNAELLRHSTVNKNGTPKTTPKHVKFRNILQMTDPKDVLDAMFVGRVDCNHRVEAMVTRSRTLRAQIESGGPGVEHKELIQKLSDLEGGGIPVTLQSFADEASTCAWSRQLNVDRDIGVRFPRLCSSLVQPLC